MKISDRVLVSGSKIMLVMIKGPPRVGWVLSIEEVTQLFDALIDAVQKAEHYLKHAPVPGVGYQSSPPSRAKISENEE